MTNKKEEMWSEQYENALKKEVKILLNETLNCAQVPNADKLMAMGMMRLGLSALYDSPPLSLQAWLKCVLERKYFESILSMEHLEEVIFHSSSIIQIFANGKPPFFQNMELSDEDYLLSLQILCQEKSIAWNYSEPFASFTIEYQQQVFRATLIHPSINKTSNCKLFLRRIKAESYPLSSYCSQNQVECILKKIIDEKANILIAGATGSGKTGLLSSLLNIIPENQHIIALEDTDELVCKSSAFTKLLSHPQKNKSLSDYMTYAMRMRPERIILGEMRSHEVIPFILATNTGHKGLMATIHANSAKEAVDRVATLFAIYNNSVDMAHRHVQKLISRNMDYVIYLKDKKIYEIIRPIGNEGEHLLYIEEYLQAN